MRCSICIATHEKPIHLYHVLYSIYRQDIPFSWECIVVDDGSVETYVPKFPCKYTYINRPGGYRNPAYARNVAYQQATGEIVIAQSDDIEHQGPDVVRRLVEELQQGEFLLANVYDVNFHSRTIGKQLSRHTKPTFFLGSLWRKDLYAVGGNDERFVHPGYDDRYFVDCLTKGLGLKPRWFKEIIGHHLSHTRPTNIRQLHRKSKRTYLQLVKESRWMAQGGSWHYE